MESPCECGIEPAGSISQLIQAGGKILTGKPTGKRPLGRPRLRWEDNIRMNLEGIGINTNKRINSAKDRDCWRALLN